MRKIILVAVPLFFLLIDINAQTAIFKEAGVQSFSSKTFFRSLFIDKQQFKNLRLVHDSASGDQFWMPAQEITNEAYRNFTTYCRDSIARVFLGYFISIIDDEYIINRKRSLGWKGGSFAEHVDYLLDINTHGKRHYEDLRLDVDASSIRYGDWSDSNNIVVIYPDTTCWLKEIGDSVKTKNYFSNPSFNHYPVVGISYWQVVAYCKWLEQIWNSALQKAGNTTNYFEVRLPAKQEWDAALQIEAPQYGNFVFSKQQLSQYKKNGIYHLSSGVAEWLYDSTDSQTNTAGIKEITETSWSANNFKTHLPATAQRTYIGFRYVVRLKTKEAVSKNK